MGTLSSRDSNPWQPSCAPRAKKPAPSRGKKRATSGRKRIMGTLSPRDSNPWQPSCALRAKKRASPRPEGARLLPGASSPWKGSPPCHLPLFVLRPEGGRSSRIEPRPPAGRKRRRGEGRQPGTQVPGKHRAPSGRTNARFLARRAHVRCQGLRAPGTEAYPSLLPLFLLRPEGGRSSRIEPRPPSGRERRRGEGRQPGTEVPGKHRAPSGRRE